MSYIYPTPYISKLYTELWTNERIPTFFMKESDFITLRIAVQRIVKNYVRHVFFNCKK